jgi:thiamine biosynthesis lipoprotein
MNKTASAPRASGSGRRLSLRHEVMGTVFTLDVVTDLPEEVVDQAIRQAFDWLTWVDVTFSTYQENSEVSRLRRCEIGLGGCHPEVRAIEAACRALNEETEGFFDAWAGPARAFDPSGLVKGWAAERASALLSAAGAPNHCLNAAGDIALSGAPAPGVRWRVGIVHPFAPQALSAVVEVGTGGVATSGTAERGGHVFDPFTRLPVTDLASVTVIGPSLAQADAYATAAMAMGTDARIWLPSLEGFESYVIDAGGHVWASEGLPAYRIA